MIDVVLVAPVRAYRDAFAVALRADRGLALRAHVGTGAEAIAAIGPNHPEVVLLDFGLSDAVPLLSSLRGSAPRTRLIAIGIDPGKSDAAAIIRAAQAGMWGFLDEDQPMSEVVDAVRLAVRGQSSCSPRIAALLLQALHQRPAPPSMPADLWHGSDLHPALTPRERVVAELAARGLTNRQIATQLVVGESTVKSHVHAVLTKLGIRCREEIELSSAFDHQAIVAKNDVSTTRFSTGGDEVEEACPPRFSTSSQYLGRITPPY